tara:strand:- start:363 stop:854 length:492 start_codon:yes stop_codon:yes gene_type:complete
MNIEDDLHDCLDDEEVQSLLLTRDELFYIDDNLTMMIEKESRNGGDNQFSTVRPVIATAGIPAPVELLEKIGFAVLQVTDEDEVWDKTISVPVTSTDLYMLRELARSTIKVNGKFLGLELKKKIYQLLYADEFKVEKNIEKLLADVNIAEDTIPLMDWSEGTE